MPFSTTDAEEGARNGHDSTTDNVEDIETMPFSTADTEEGARNGHDSTTDAAKYIETQAFSIPDPEEDALNGHDSTTDAAKGIETQAFSTTDAEEDALNGHDFTTDNAKDIDTQAFSTAGTEEGALNGHDSTTDTTKDIETQAFSTTDTAGSLGALPFSAAKGRWGVRSPRGPDPPTGDGHYSTDTGNDFADAENHFTAHPSNFSADRHSPAAVGTALAADPPIFADDECRPLRTLTEKHPYLNPSFHEPHPLLRLHPPSFGGFGRTFRVQSAQPPFGRPFLGRFVDIRPACTVGSRPLRPRLTLCRTKRSRCRLEHPDRECTTSANAVERSANAIRPPADAAEHGTNGRKTERNAPEHAANAVSTPADTIEHDARRAKNADFIDADPAREHKTERNAPERSANAVSTPADGHEHDAQRAKNADFIDADPARGHQTERNAPERSANAVSTPADERKRHDPAPEHPAYDPDAGQRVLRSAAHRRAVRAEREACCGALRHLAHCCVAF